MAAKIRLRIATPQRLLLDEEVDELSAPGVLGELGILPDHITFLGALETGRLSFRRGGAAARHLAVGGGFAEVVDNVVTVLADTAEFAEEVDVERAREALRQGQARLRQLSPYESEYEEVEARVRRAQVRLEVSGRA
jgi:F-type H+-transporting ATPase subunit epsilon